MEKQDEMLDYFNKLSWQDIKVTIEQVKLIHKLKPDIKEKEPLIEAILDYVELHKGISFKQWKVLFLHVKYHTNRVKHYKNADE